MFYICMHTYTGKFCKNSKIALCFAGNKIIILSHLNISAKVTPPCACIHCCALVPWGIYSGAYSHSRFTLFIGILYIYREADSVNLQLRLALPLQKQCCISGCVCRCADAGGDGEGVGWTPGRGQRCPPGAPRWL